MNPLSEEPIQDDLAFMRDPGRWPNWPYQTIKNPRQKQVSGFPRLGVLVDTLLQYPSGKPIIRFKEVNLWTVTKSSTLIQGSIEADFEALIKEGWVID